MKPPVRPLFAPLPPETRRLLDRIPALIDKTFPMPTRFRPGLPADVAELSRLLTSDRGERSLSYLGRPSLLSAYLRFFVPWNLYRLCRLLPGLNLALAANDRITDMGCGPLTFAAALWICRPDLRTLPLEFYCIDRSGPALDAGRKFFAALAGENNPWNIRTVKGDLYTVKAKSAALVCAVNVFNEMYGDISRGGNLRRNAEKSARLLVNHASAGDSARDAATGAASAAILTVEPGFPRCGEFISLLRGVLMERGHHPVSPCPHNMTCPFPGGTEKKGKKRWCHFAFETEDAPPALHKLSEAAGIPKERAVLSFLFTGPADKKREAAESAEEVSSPIHADLTTEDTSNLRFEFHGGIISSIDFKPRGTPCNSVVKNLKLTHMATSPSTLRVISDAFPLPPNRFGRYCCSARGLVLLAGIKSAIERTASGALVHAIFKNSERDSKSGALVAEEESHTKSTKKE